jgi:integrase
VATLLKPWIVRYLNPDGRQVAKGSPGARKVKERAAKWYGQYIDLDGRRRRVPLCTDKVAARQMLANLERDVQLGQAGMVDRYAKHRRSSIDSHVSDYETHLRNKGLSPKGMYEELRKLRAVLGGCEVRTLADLRPEAVERFLGTLADRKVSASTRNHYLSTMKTFSRWCLRANRIGDDVLACLQRVKGEIRRKRRALTEEELGRLLKAARERPLVEVSTIRSGRKKGQRVAAGPRRPETRAKAERLGWERTLLYKTLVCTGLRRGELAALEARFLTLEGLRPCVTLPPSLTKNRQEACLPLRADLAQELSEWLKVTGKSGTDRVFRVSRNLYKILRRDLALAGIAYKDERGRTIDVHALRHTTATYLSRAKVAPRVAQNFMRHSDIRLTMQTYTDASLLDEAEALNALPKMPLSGPTKAEEDKTGK